MDLQDFTNRFRFFRGYTGGANQRYFQGNSQKYFAHTFKFLIFFAYLLILSGGWMFLSQESPVAKHEIEEGENQQRIKNVRASLQAERSKVRNLSYGASSVRVKPQNDQVILAIKKGSK